jgi:hypothetical protein
MKQRYFVQNASFHLNENGTKTYQFPNQSLAFYLFIKSSIGILILRINSIVSLPNSKVTSDVGHLFLFSPQYWICAFWPSIDKKTFNFFNLTPDLVNFSPYIHAPFPVWFLVLDFFNQVSNCPSTSIFMQLNPWFDQINT